MNRRLKFGLLPGLVAVLLGSLAWQSAYGADTYVFQRTVTTRTLTTPVALETRTMMLERPMMVERVIEKPVLVESTLAAPVIIERPLTVERVIERPVTVERVIERPVTVERVIERPVTIERVIEKPIVIKQKRHLFELGLF